MTTLFERVLYFIGGLSSFGLGYEIYRKGGWWSWKSQMFINYEGMRGPITVLFILIGLMALFLAFKKNTICEHICVSCQHVEEKKIGVKHTCSRCGSNMEELKGFYSRYPEK